MPSNQQSESITDATIAAIASLQALVLDLCEKRAYAILRDDGEISVIFHGQVYDGTPESPHIHKQVVRIIPDIYEEIL